MNCSRMGMNRQKIMNAGDSRKVARQPWKNSMQAMASKVTAALWGSSEEDDEKRKGMVVAAMSNAHAAPRSFMEDAAKLASFARKRRNPK